MKRLKTKLEQKWKLKLEKPSPTYQNSSVDSARNPLFTLKRFIKGISLFASRASGSMTVEASIVLPLLLFFFLNLGCAIEMIRLQGNLQLSLWQIGRELSVYGYALDSGEMPEEEQGEDDWWKDLGGKVFSSVFIKDRLVKLTGKAYLDSSPLTKGSSSLQLWKSEIFGDGDIMDIVVTYSVSPWSALAGFPSFRMVNRYYTHIWNGYQLAEEEETAEENRTVYVTAGSRVYHLFRDCTHLQLSIRTIPGTEAGRVRNQNGERYRPCGKCGNHDDMPDILYITETGDCYHYMRECPGLKRSVYAITLKEAAGLRVCSRCNK